MYYALIGNSLLSVKIAEKIRQSDPEGEISIFCPEGVLPYQRHLVASVLADAKIAQLACVSEDFYTTNRIKVVLDKKIAKVHPKRKRILTEDKEQIPFDVLIIEDGGDIVFGDMKGVQKQGVFHLKTFRDAEKLLSFLGLCEIVILEVNNIVALQAACHLRKLNKEVIAVIPSGHLLSDLLDKDVADHLADHLQRSGIRFIYHNAIVEVLGDNEVKAIRLKTGKVLESQLVVLSQTDQSLSLLNVDDLAKEETTDCVKYEDVYCVKDLTRALDRSLWEDFLIHQHVSSVQAQNIVAMILKQPSATITAPLMRSFDVSDLSMHLLGVCKKDDQATAYMKVDYKINAYKKIFVYEGVIKGAVLINNASDAAALSRLIAEGKNISDITGSIVDYQGG